MNTPSNSNAITPIIGLFMSDVFQFAQDAVMDVAEETGMSPAEYATTLIVVVLTPDALVAAMIGDGMVIIEDESGEYSCLFDLPKHEYANQVTPITSQRCQDELQVKIVGYTSSISVHHHRWFASLVLRPEDAHSTSALFPDDAFLV